MIPRAIALLALAACTPSGSDPADPTEPVAPPAEAVPDADPGTKTLHRLNRTEYDNTVADLLHTQLRVAQTMFPADVSSFGFDNQADALTITPIQAELYERAAEALADDLMRVRDESTELVGLNYNSPGVVPINGVVTERAYAFHGEGSLSATFPALDDGTYALRVTAFGLAVGDIPVRLAIELDGEVLGEFVADPSDPTTHEVEVWLPGGDATLTARFVNPVADEGTEAVRVLSVRRLEIEGPVDPEVGHRDGYHEVVSCDPADIGETACATHTLTDLARAAWRRPLTEDDTQWLLDAYDEARSAGLTWNDAVAYGVKVVLLSPDFLFRIEADPEPGEVRDLSSHELATRLSYLLWSTTPDPALMAEADRGTLIQPDALEWHTQRMLDDPRAEALVDGFASQWLSVSALEGLQPDPDLFPDFDEPLRQSMGEELRRIARDHILGDKPLLEMLMSQETWIDARLAEHYDLPHDGSAEWVVADLSGTSRHGLLTSAGLLSLTSHPDRASVVRRGKLVLGSLLCSEPPPPPPGVEGLEDVDPETFDTVREQLEAHRADPTCNTCHQEMDPVGFALQPFDAIGMQRSVDEMGAPIDPSATLPDGTELRGPYGVAQWASTDPRWPECVAEKVFTWGVGRVPTTTDAPTIDAMVQELTTTDGTFETVVMSLVESPPFRMKAAEVLP